MLMQIYILESVQFKDGFLEIIFYLYYTLGVFIHFYILCATFEISHECIKTNSLFTLVDPY